MEESIDVTNDFKSNKRLLGAVDVTDKLRDSRVLVDVVAVAVANAIVDFGFDVVAAAVVVVAATSAVDDDYDCDYDDDFVAPSTSRIFACRDRVPVEVAPHRSLYAEAHSANSY